MSRPASRIGAAMYRLFICLFLFASLTFPASAADVENGRKLARQCSACHGKFGLSKDPEVPNLAGQPSLYLEKSLKDYRDGAREDRRMTLISEPLTDDDVRDLAAWFASIEFNVVTPD